jgi:hypothetical protein
MEHVILAFVLLLQIHGLPLSTHLIHQLKPKKNPDDMVSECS